MNTLIPISCNSPPGPPVKRAIGSDLLLPLALCIILLFGSSLAMASNTYQPLSSRFVGYSEEEIGQAYFDIHYSGKWKQSHQLMGRYALFRSAELALEMGFPAFTIDSAVLLDEPDVQIYRTCSDIRVLSNSTVPAATLVVRYLDKIPTNRSGTFSTRELIGLKELLLNEDKRFNLRAYLKAHGVALVDEREH